MQTLQNDLVRLGHDIEGDLRGGSVGGVVEDDFNALALDDAHDCLVGAKINAYSLIVS